ncbi:MAG: glycosyltransferase family 39 protein [Bacteroidales bacterium]|nr:glycosyltransferase family 39 protein [Bacteroidales bacterium]
MLKNKYLIFLSIWFVINLIQAYFTQLHYDEAYYWAFSKYLDWGYFDHPPFVALLIKLGYYLFNNELGVRLFHVLLSTGTMYLLLLLTEENDDEIFLLVFISSFFLIHTHVAGFLALPDTPLVFFSALFFVLYKKYITKYSYKYVFFLAIVIAAMIYSKYHAVLIILLTVISNIKLIYKKSFWLIVFLVVLFIIPHILWQYNNGFPSFKFHLIERSSPFQIKNFTSFVVSQIFVVGLLTGPIVFYLAIKYKPKNIFEKTLKYNALGIFLFFMFFSIRDWIETHWTSIAYIPLIIISYQEIRNNRNLKKLFTWLAVPTIVLITFIRIVLMYERIGININEIKRFHQWDKASNEIKELSNGRDVVFINSYKLASLYSFYSKSKISPSIPSYHYRHTQFDIWQFENNLIGKDIILIGEYISSKNFLKTDIVNKYKYKFIKDFITYNGLQISTRESIIITKFGDKLIVPVLIENTTNRTFNLLKNPELFPSIAFHNINIDYDLDTYTKLTDYGIHIINPYEKYMINVEVNLPLVVDQIEGFFIIIYGERLKICTTDPINIRIDSE